MLAGCDAGKTSTESWKPQVLREGQVELVATIAEHIIPETDTVGARAAAVHRFVDAMLAQHYRPEERQRFLAGLADVDARARRQHGNAFLNCDPSQQRAILEELDREAYPPRTRAQTVAEPSSETERGGGGTPPTNGRTDTTRQAALRTAEQPFMRMMKELTVLGYYTSEMGATRELRYERVPGRYQGCVPFTTVGRTWA